MASAWLRWCIWQLRRDFRDRADVARMGTSGNLRSVDGFRGARLLRQDDGHEVMFTSITFFTGLDAVRAFAGDDYERAVVEAEARRALSRWDERVSHHDVAIDLQR